MGKTKQLVRSLRSRLPFFKVKQSPSPPRSSASSASSHTYASTSSAHLSSSPSPVEYATYTPPTTTSTATRAITSSKPEAGVAPSAHEVASLLSPGWPSLKIQQCSSPPMSCESSAASYTCTPKSYTHPPSLPVAAKSNTYTPPATPCPAPRAITRIEPDLEVASLPSSQRLSIKGSQLYPSPPRSSGSDTSSTIYVRRPHAVLSSSPAPVEHDTFTPLTTAPTTPQTVHHVDSEPSTTTKAYEVAVLPTLKEDNACEEFPPVNARAELAASNAMLEFARKLPLEELSTIGHGLEPHKKLVTEREAIIYVAELPSSPTLHHRPHNPSVDQGSVASAIDTPKIKSYRSRTVGLSSESSTSTWSFACRSARRIEREHEAGGDNDDASSFGSLSGWGVTFNDDEDGRELLDDAVEDQSQKNARWSDAASSESLGSVSLPSRQDSSFVTMSDEDFEALPNYSDIEDDPEYEYDYDDDFF